MASDIDRSYVKNQITIAMLELLKEYDLKSITISKLSSKANVSRASFYRNYDEKEDVLREFISSLILDWHEKNKNEEEEEMLGSLFEHFILQKDFYLLLTERKLFHLLKEILKEFYGPKPEYPNFGAYVAAYFF